MLCPEKKHSKMTKSSFTVPFFSLSCIFSYIFHVMGATDAPLCTFGKHTKSISEMHKRLQPLLGQRYTVKDDKYEYNIGICTDAVIEKTFGQNVGVLQTSLDGDPPKHWIIGLYNDSQLITGDDWVLLEYNGGDLYSSHCGSERRRSRLMIACDNTVKQGDEGLSVQILGEETDKTDDCYYLFEVKTSTVCIKQPLITVGLSVGSILIIIFVVVVFLYCALGFGYNRLVLGAKGKEQIPNYSFWTDFGNLQADGCNLVCRSGSRFESKQYKGVGDDQLQEEEDRDDHLLPM